MSNDRPLFSIVIVGAGGLGVPAAIGIHTISTREAIRSTSQEETAPPLSVTIIEHDTVELSNLHRQVLYEERDLGRNKGVVLVEKFQTMHSPLAWHSHEVQLTEESIDRYIGPANIVIDGTDSLPTKLLLNDFCVVHGIPYCYGGVVGESGLAMLVDRNGAGPGCLRCLFGFSGEDDLKNYESCQRSGILGPLAGFIGLLQAELAMDGYRSRYSMRGSSDRSHLAAQMNPTCNLAGSELYSLDGPRISDESESFRRRTIPPWKSCPLGCGSAAPAFLDLRSIRCPENFLYAKLAVERSDSGSIRILFHSKDSADEVSASLMEEGHTVRRPITIGRGSWQVCAARGVSV